jgi:hypothetical protein
VQEPFLLHRTRSFRVTRSFHDHAAGQQPHRVSCAAVAHVASTNGSADSGLSASRWPVPVRIQRTLTSCR